MFGNSSKGFSAVILAGGSGSRLGGDVPKQLFEILGRPLISYSLEAFQNSAHCREIVIVCPEGEEKTYRDIAERYHIDKLAAVAAGGATRQISSLRGFLKTDDRIRYVAIHDAARCLITTDMINRIYLVAAATKDCVIAASRIPDTLKTADPLGYVTDTPDRGKTFAAATPQFFYRNTYKAVAFTAVKDGFSATDDSALAEHYGIRTKLEILDEPNFKVTYPQDILTAEALLKARTKGK